MDDTSKLTRLGSERTDYPKVPTIDILETFANQKPARNYVVVHRSDEFTSLCPKTGQPDFAEVEIRFVPGSLCVETKSLKLYLFAFRNIGSFMETIANRICDDLTIVMNPKWLKVSMVFGSRGGISTQVIAEYGVHPNELRRG